MPPFIHALNVFNGDDSLEKKKIKPALEREKKRPIFDVDHNTSPTVQPSSDFVLIRI